MNELSARAVTFETPLSGGWAAPFPCIVDGDTPIFDAEDLSILIFEGAFDIGLRIGFVPGRFFAELQIRS